MSSVQKIPVKEKVKRFILDNISSQKYLFGQKIPTVRELVVELGISHTSVAQAIQELTTDGILTPKVGCGTFVTGKIEHLPQSSTAFYSSNEAKRVLYFFFTQSSREGIDSYHAKVLCHIQQEAEKRSWKLNIELYDKKKFQEAGANPLAVGIIIANMPELPRLLIPVITYGMSPFQDSPCCVTPDNYGAGVAAAIMLRSRKPSILRFINVYESGGSGNTLHFHERRAGFYDTCKKYSMRVAPELSWSIIDHIAEVEEALARIAQNNDNESLPETWVVGNRAMAFEIAGFAKMRGIKIPEQLSLIAFIRRSEREDTYPVDVFDFDHAEMAEWCMVLLDRALQNKKLPVRVLIPMNFYPGSSNTDS